MKDVVYICGATAVGKTSRAIALAKEIDGEIVNGDAFQLFKGIEVLSAAPTDGEMAEIPHHLFGVLTPGESCDAGRYSEMASEVVAEIGSRGKPAIVAGGSGLYLKFLTHGASPLPRGDKALRDRLEKRTLEDLLGELELLDPIEAASVDRKNPRYVARALEICLLSGGKVSGMRDRWAARTRSIEAGLEGVWLTRPRDELHGRIAARTRRMLEGGASDEVRAFQDVPGNWEKAIGVKELKRLIAGEISKAECEDLICAATRQYAKRQETWFRREHWLKREQL